MAGISSRVMAVVLYRPKDNEHRMIQVLMSYFDWQQNECFPNVCCFPWESDLLVVSPSGYVSEIEVKCSIADWRADAKKTKFVDPQTRFLFSRKVRRFYYAVPEKLLAQRPDIPRGTGLLSFNGRRFDLVEDAQQRQGAEKIDDRTLFKLRRSIYFRFCREYRRGIPGSISLGSLPGESSNWPTTAAAR